MLPISSVRVWVFFLKKQGRIFPTHEFSSSGRVGTAKPKLSALSWGCPWEEGEWEEGFGLQIPGKFVSDNIFIWMLQLLLPFPAAHSYPRNAWLILLLFASFFHLLQTSVLIIWSNSSLSFVSLRLDGHGLFFVGKPTETECCLRMTGL